MSRPIGYDGRWSTPTALVVRVVAWAALSGLFVGTGYVLLLVVLALWGRR